MKKWPSVMIVAALLVSSCIPVGSWLARKFVEPAAIGLGGCIAFETTDVDEGIDQGMEEIVDGDAK